MYIFHTKNFQSNLLTVHIRLVHTYVHHANKKKLRETTEERKVRLARQREQGFLTHLCHIGTIKAVLI